MTRLSLIFIFGLMLFLAAVVLLVRLPVFGTAVIALIGTGGVLGWIVGHREVSAAGTERRALEEVARSQNLVFANEPARRALILAMTKKDSWFHERLAESQQRMGEGSVTAEQLELERHYRQRDDEGTPVVVTPVAETKRVRFGGLELTLRVKETNFVILNPIRWSRIPDGQYSHVPHPMSGQIPPGRLTDYASIPALARPLVGGPTGDAGRAGVVHDYGYRYDLERSAERRREWDQTLLTLMRQDSVAPLRRVLIYVAVRVFGRFAYNAGSRHVGGAEQQDQIVELEKFARRVWNGMGEQFDESGSPVPPPEVIASLSIPPECFADVIADMQSITKANPPKSSWWKRVFERY